MKKSRGRYLPLLILMTVLFGLTFIATKQALSGLSVFQVVFARYIVALIPLTLILWFDKQKFKIARKDRPLFLLLTIVEPVGFFIFETYGIRYTSPSMVSIIIATIPAITANATIIVSGIAVAIISFIFSPACKRIYYSLRLLKSRDSLKQNNSKNP